ncbi:MAG TPA: 3-hydroxyacyl-CoA dehydrogenase NAD-binding domain-containing protein [Burkholderiales bacterium]|nr:3-hydroxyacyl-CoA dehydrogenase NAD-binding domain-containing protein [Burkholderiales bacterium]
MNKNYKHWHPHADKEGIVWIDFDKADSSTNVLSVEVMNEFGVMLDDLIAAQPKAVIFRSAKSSGFIAGADVNEFTQGDSKEHMVGILRRGWDLFNKLAAVRFPTLALIRGFCMGGGLELALACRYRVAVDDPKTRLALPEVMLGILPGWGGVKRLSHLVGAPVALDMMLTGRAVDARRAKQIGLVDASVPPRIMDNTARSIVLSGQKPRELPFVQKLLDGPLRGVAAGMARKQLMKKATREQYPAPYAILDLWQKYDGDPFAPPPGDPASFDHLAGHPTTRNLIRVFGLQERLKSLGKGGDFKAQHVHIIGAGTMGGDIAAVCAMRGMTVTLQDMAPERIAPAVKRAADLYKKRIRDKLLVRDALDRLVPDVKGDGVRQADVIIEAIVENLAIKQELFARIEGQAKPTAIIATNTSSLKLSDISAPMKDPSRLVGIHFFNPVPQMMLVEIVSGVATKPEWAQKAAAFVRQIDKLPLPVKDASGFLVNRVLMPYVMNGLRMVEDGIAPETVDKAAETFGMPMGPVTLADTVGLDICAVVGHELDPTAVAPRKLEQLVKDKKLGKKTGEGYYKWVNGQPQKGHAGQVDEALIQRLMSPYLEEAKEVVAEGIVADADLADAGLIFATGFAPFRGGPLHYAKNR